MTLKDIRQLFLFLFFRVFKTKKYRNCVEGEYVAAIGDCTSYFVCTHGYYVRHFCASGLAWDDQKKICDWKYNVYCNYGRSSNIFTYTSKYTHTIYIIFKLNRYVINLYIHILYFIDIVVKSSVECQEGEYAFHPRDCNKYLQCLWGKFIVNSCPAGLYWNNVKLK